MVLNLEGKLVMNLDLKNSQVNLKGLEVFAKGPVLENIQVLFKNYDAIKKRNKEHDPKFNGNIIHLILYYKRRR